MIRLSRPTVAGSNLPANRFFHGLENGDSLIESLRVELARRAAENQRVGHLLLDQKRGQTLQLRMIHLPVKMLRNPSIGIFGASGRPVRSWVLTPFSSNKTECTSGLDLVRAIYRKGKLHKLS